MLCERYAAVSRLGIFSTVELKEISRRSGGEGRSRSAVLPISPHLATEVFLLKRFRPRLQRWQCGHSY